MIAPLSLSNVLTVVMAVTCLTTLLAQSPGGILRQWRLVVPASCAAINALMLLAGIIEATFTHDAEWVIAGILGSVLGRMRGWAVTIEADHARGLVRLPRTMESLFAGVVLVAVSLIDFTGATLGTP